MQYAILEKEAALRYNDRRKSKSRVPTQTTCKTGRENMKKLRFFFALTLILCALLCGCSEKISFPYADIETPIESIELLRHPWYA